MVDAIIYIVMFLIGLYLLSVILCPLYFKWGIFKRFYHDMLGWHQPDEIASVYFDGLSTHDICKHCGKDIMQDSQGNWF